MWHIIWQQHGGAPCMLLPQLSPSIGYRAHVKSYVGIVYVVLFVQSKAATK